MTVHGGGPAYRSAWARDDQSGAVAMRAHAVNGQYQAHARRLDRLPGVPPMATPAALRLASFGAVRALVFGQYAEVSNDVLSLVAECARLIARAHWRRMGCRSESEAYGIIVSSLRRQVGAVAARAQARHRISRWQWVGVPRAVVDARNAARRTARGHLGGAAVPPAEPDPELLRDVMVHQSHAAAVAGH